MEFIKIEKYIKENHPQLLYNLYLIEYNYYKNINDLNYIKEELSGYNFKELLKTLKEEYKFEILKYYIDRKTRIKETIINYNKNLFELSSAIEFYNNNKKKKIDHMILNEIFNVKYSELIDIIKIYHVKGISILKSEKIKELFRNYKRKQAANLIKIKLRCLMNIELLLYKIFSVNKKYSIKNIEELFDKYSLDIFGLRDELNKIYEKELKKKEK